MTTQNKKIKILAVDDTPSNLVALEAVFSGSGYELILATSGYEAIVHLQRNDDIALILLDVQMPHMDGFETAVRIKQIENCREIPIIFITAVYREDPFIKKGYEVGAVDYFGKPFDPEILKMKVSIYTSFWEKTHLLKEREKRILETEELLKAGRKLSSILETLPVGVLIADGDGKICQVNEEVSRILKQVEANETDAYGEILGWWDKDGQMLKDEAGPLAHALQGETSHNQKIRIKCFDGNHKTLLASASPLRALDGHIVGAGIVVQDVTESRKVEEDLEDRILNLISLGVEFEQSATIQQMPKI